MKISILLPYKENFSSKYAGAVSLFTKDTTAQSRYKDSITVFGFTKYKSKLLKNYINLNIGKSLLQSNSKIYIAGHNGMIGSTLFSKLIDNGFNIIIDHIFLYENWYNDFSSKINQGESKCRRGRWPADSP